VNDRLQETRLRAKDMRASDLWLILIANGLFALVTNLLFLFDAIRPLKSSQNLWNPLLLGMGVYGIQLALIAYLVTRLIARSWLIDALRVKDWYWGLVVGLLIWVVANGVTAYRTPYEYLRLNPMRGFSRFVWIFLFSSLPGALIEEYLFRYLPVRYAEYRGLSRVKTIMLFLAVLVFFTATHIPAYLWQYKISIWTLWSPFTMGTAFFFVYYATRNLAFTAFFHAFTNQSWMLFGSADITDYSLVIVVSIVWFFVRTSRAHSSNQSG
jgi:hypothetical protein